jgi:hypothetical protein
MRNRKTVASRKIAGRKQESEQTDTKVLCVVCSNFFMLPKTCLECCNWNVCLACLRAESEETNARLAERGIVLPPLGGEWGE